LEVCKEMIPPKPKKAAMLVFDPDAKKKKKVMVRKRKPRKLLYQFFCVLCLQFACKLFFSPKRVQKYV